MPKQAAPVEINRFVGGLNTDLSPLTPANEFSLDERNMVLNSDGSRQRRLGMDFEEAHVDITASVFQSATVNYFKWENAGGNVGKNILVLQMGNSVRFFDLSSRPISAGLFPNSFTVSSSDPIKFSFTSVNGLLVIAYNAPTLRVYDFDGEDIDLVYSGSTLKIRDLFGVEDKVGSTNLYEGSGLQFRPPSLSSAHRYNLRNQTWGIPRTTDAEYPSGSGQLLDPITIFRGYAGNKYPSNSDAVTQSVFADPGIGEGGDRTIERFHAKDLVKNPLGATKAPQGYFIIDALNRGASRYQEYENNRNNYPQIGYALGSGSLPADRTPGGATAVGQYAGRAWFGGFSGEVVGGDENSPRMSSYVLFSTLVKNPSDIFKCYQEGDPTSADFPDVIDTDGGFIRIDEASGINRLINISDSLIIMAENGIWRVNGTSENGFTATAFRVSKVSEKGCKNPSTAVEVDNTIFYWSEDGIYHIRPNEFGDIVSVPLIVDRIQTLYNSFTEDDKLNAVGAYDRYQRKIKWVYHNNYNDTDSTKELVFDLTLSAFYLNEIKSIGNGVPRLLAVVEASEYTLNEETEDVLVINDPVLVNTDQVEVSVVTRSDVERGNLAYLIVTGINESQLTFTFGNYTDEEFIDWKSYDGVGVDAEAYVVTNYFSGEDFQREKKITYLTAYLKKTEVGYEMVNGELVPINPSSCITQIMWEWSNNVNSGRWSRPFQAYRHTRMYIPTDVNDTFDNGFATVVTRNKVRGKGKVLSIKFSTEPKKDLHLYGWSMIVMVNTNV